MSAKPELRRLSSADPNFAAEFERLLSRASEFDPQIESAVSEIIAAVRSRGDAAVLEMTAKFDQHRVATAAALEILPQQVRQARQRIAPELLDALAAAAQRIQSYHARQLDNSWSYTESDGSVYGQNIRPIEKVGIYIPGGQASYPSSVLMTAIPAKVAGVSEVAMVVPAPQGKVRDAVIAAADIAGVDRIFAIGGAQAIAALAFGTETIPRVDKIVGPGSAWVSAAKRQVFGHVGIDLIAGPSEVVVACDAGVNAQWAAMDLFAQAEHDVNAQSILLSDSSAAIARVQAAIEALLPPLERRLIIAESLASHGALIEVRDRAEMLELIDQIAPEHLELMLDDAMDMAQRVSNAGAIFVGPYSAEVLGDYCAGPNHVLPTSGSARFSSPLGVYDYLKRTSIIACSPQGARQLASTAQVLACEEQLTAHAQAARHRSGK